MDRISVPYRRMEAVNYASTYAVMPNPKMKMLKSDCANFVSQCLHAGGYPRRIDWQGPGADMKSFGDMPNWTRADRLYPYLLKKGWGRDTRESELIIGDVVFFKEYDVIYHCVLVTGRNASGPLVCAHTNARLHAELAKLGNSGTHLPVKIGDVITYDI